MKKYILIFLTAIISVISFGNSYSQGIVRKVKLHVIPVGTHFKMSVPFNKVKNIATIKIVFKESNEALECNEFLDMITALTPESEIEIAQDYRIVCIVHKIFGKEVLYFNTFGDFLYNGKTYKNDKIKSFVFNHMPESCK